MNKVNRDLSYYVFIPAGPIYEKGKYAGISHLIEHILFNFLEQDKKFDEYLNKHNIYYSVSTNEHFTYVVFEEIDRNHLRYIQEKLKSIFKDPKYSEKVIEYEKDIIKEEILFYKEDRVSLAEDYLNKLIFHNKSLKQPTRGSLKSVLGFSKNNLESWHKRLYEKENIIEIVYSNKSNKVNITAKKNLNIPKARLAKLTPLWVLKNKWKSKSIICGWAVKNITKEELIKLNLIRRIFSEQSHNKEGRALISSEKVYYKEVMVGHFNGFSIIYFHFFNSRPKSILKSIISISQDYPLIDSCIENNWEESIKKELDYYQLSGGDKVYEIGSDMLTRGEIITVEERIDVLKNIKLKELQEFYRKIFNSGFFQEVIG